MTQSKIGVVIQCGENNRDFVGFCVTGAGIEQSLTTVNNRRRKERMLAVMIVTHGMYMYGAYLYFTRKRNPGDLKG